MKSFVNELQSRLVKFSGEIIDITRMMPSDMAGKYLAQQLLRSGMSPSLNYAEACSAESKADFIHKMKVCLKELRESSVCLQIIGQKIQIERKLDVIQKETEELISIFVKSIQTAEKNKNALIPIEKSRF